MMNSQWPKMAQTETCPVHYNILPKIQIMIRNYLRQFLANSINGKDQYPLGSIVLVSHRLTLSSYPGNLIFITYLPLTPQVMHPLDSSHFCKSVSICSNLVYYHWFRDNLEQVLAGSCDIILPCCSPSGRHLLSQQDALLMGD